MWFALAMAAGNAYQARQGGKRAAALEDTKYDRDLRYTEARNKAAIQAAAESQSRIAVENAGLHRQVQSALVALNTAKQRALGTEVANIAASGSTGASAQAAMADIEHSADRAHAGIQYNRVVAEERIRNTLSDVWDAASASTQELPMRPDRRGRNTDTFLAVSGAAFKGYRFGTSFEPASTPSSPGTTPGEGRGVRLTGALQSDGADLGPDNDYSY